MRLWPILAIAYLVIGIGCYIAILKFLRPQPLISTREHTDSAKGEGKNRVRVRRWNSMLALLIGLEASTLQSWTLKRRGWREIGIVVADELEAAERRFFDELHNQDAVDFGASVPARMAMLDRSQQGTDVIGLFPEPRGSR